MADGFGHVVERERGDGRAGEGFHFDAGLGVGLRMAMDTHFAGAVGQEARIDVDLAIVERERVAERDEFAGFFCAHHAGENRGLKDRTFFRGDLTIAEEHGEFRRERNGGDGAGGAARNGFGADVDHRGAVVRVEVGEHEGEND